MTMVGMAGFPPTKPWHSWGFFYDWAFSGALLPKTAPLHKLRRPSGVPNRRYDACCEAVDFIVDRMSRDEWGRRHGRVIQLLNEPDSGGESSWPNTPSIAAFWCAAVMRRVRAVAPWVRFAGPNMVGLSAPWLAAFMQALVAQGQTLDVYAVHGYMALWDGWDYLTAHLRAVRQAWSGRGLADGFPIWITEIGAITGMTPQEVKVIMGEIEAYQVEQGEGLGITAWAWFLSYDREVAKRTPETMLYPSRAANVGMTSAGERWWNVWDSLSHGKKRQEGTG